MLQRTVLLFGLLISCSTFKITAVGDPIDFLRDLQHWQGAKDLAFAINKQTTALRAMQDKETLAAFSEKFIGSKHIKKINFYYSENIEKDHEKNKKFLRYLWVLFNFFQEKLVDGLEGDTLAFAKEFCNKIIDRIAQNNEKTRGMVLCLKYMYFSANSPSIDDADSIDNIDSIEDKKRKRAIRISEALKQIINNENLSSSAKKKLLNHLKISWRYFRDFELGVDEGAMRLEVNLNSAQGKEIVDVMGAIQLCYASGVSILQKLENEFLGKSANSNKGAGRRLDSGIRMLDPESGELKEVVIMTKEEVEAEWLKEQKDEQSIENIKKNAPSFPQTSDQQSESEPAKQIVNVKSASALLEKIIDDEEAHEDLPKASLASSTKNKNPLFAVGTIFVAVGGTYYVVEKTKYGKQLKQFAKEHPKAAITLSGLATIIVGGGAAMIYKSVNN